MDNISSRMARPLMKPETSSFQENRKDPRKERSYNSYYDVYVKKMAAKLIEEKDRRVRISPFEEQWLGGNWRRVDEKEMFPVVSVDGSRLIKQYGHFIFAFNDEYLLLGVPGGNDAEERPDDGASGFGVWQSIKGSEIYGYWLLMIDRNTGRIAEIS